MDVIQKLIDGKIISQPIDEANGEGISTKVWKNDTFLEIPLKTIGEAVFIDCEFRLTDFSRTQFFNCLFINCRFKKTDFYKSEFFDTEFFNCEFKEVYMQRANNSILQNFLQKSQFVNCNFQNSNLQAMMFSNTVLVKCTFTNCNLLGVGFSDCEFMKLKFNNSELKKIYGSRIKMWYLNDTISSSTLETILLDENQTKQAPQTDKNLDEGFSN